MSQKKNWLKLNCHFGRSFWNNWYLCDIFVIIQRCWWIRRWQSFFFLKKKKFREILKTHTFGKKIEIKLQECAVLFRFCKKTWVYHLMSRHMVTLIDVVECEIRCHKIVLNKLVWKWATHTSYTYLIHLHCKNFSHSFAFMYVVRGLDVCRPLRSFY